MCLESAAVGGVGAVVLVRDGGVVGEERAGCAGLGPTSAAALPDSLDPL